MTIESTDTQAAQRLTAGFESIRAELGKQIVGMDRVIEELLISVFSRGHCLLVGVPGLAKTLLISSLSRTLSLSFARIQFTPDLMPADIVGTNVVVEDASGRKSFQFQPGPVFAQILLADEINRATPKTQSALLEAMQEGAVTVAGTRRELPQPFLVLATQNPIEMEGTYPLPEAQLDRFFFKVLVDAPDEETLVRILEATTGRGAGTVEPVLSAADVLSLRDLARRVPVAAPLVRHAARLVAATQPAGAHAATRVRKFLRYGAGVRAAQSIVLAGKVLALLDGRAHVSLDDLAAAAKPALRHRLVLNFEGEAEGVTADAIVENAIEETPSLPPDVARLGRS